MAKQILLNGTTANDKTGDTLRAAATKINANFAEIYTALGNGTALTVAAVAKTGDYNDLTNKPTITNADWNATSGIAQILNKPTLPDFGLIDSSLLPIGTGYDVGSLSFPFQSGYFTDVLTSYKFSGTRLKLVITPDQTNSVEEGTLSIADGLVWNPKGDGSKALMIFLNNTWNIVF